jgi:hypothetical protein
MRCEDKKMKPIPFILILIMLGMINNCAIGRLHSSDSIEIWVVDGDTEQPLEGVVAVAHWEQKGGLEGGNVIGQLQIMEAVSDKDGHIFFPAWEKVGIRPSSTSPDILLFKPEYKYQSLFNDVFRSGRSAFQLMLTPEGKMFSEWSGKKIQMWKFEGKRNEYRREVIRYSDKLHSVIENCGWKEVPRMMSALTEFCATNQCKLSYDVDIREWNKAYKNNKEWYKSIQKQCGISPVHFFKEYYHE